MSQFTDLNDRWPQRLATWQAAFDEKWKGRIERALLRLTQLLVSTYVLVVPLIWLMLHLAGDRWWPTTLLLLGPRWFGLLPLALLVPLALVVRPRLLLPLAAATLVFLFGVMGFCLPWPSFTRGSGQLAPISVLTCNIHGGAGGAEPLQRLLYAESPDIVAWQERGGELELPLPEDWHKVRQGSW